MTHLKNRHLDFLRLRHFCRRVAATIVHAFHLLQLHNATRLNFDQLKLVIEFGGGYGSMCRLFRQLGFKGAYVIYDLPEFSYLQEFYLQGLGLPVARLIDQDLKAGYNYLVTDTARLKQVSPKPGSSSLFVATFSLSESPDQLRQDILSLMQDCHYYLFAYQSKFDEVDNIAFFEEYAQKMSDVRWMHRVCDLFEDIIYWESDPVTLVGQNDGYC